MEGLDFKLEGAVEDLKYEGGVGVPVIRTTYKLGNFGPFVFVMDKDKYSAAAVNAEAQRMRDQLSQLK